jgi:hypothetical protein
MVDHSPRSLWSFTGRRAVLAATILVGVFTCALIASDGQLIGLSASSPAPTGHHGDVSKGSLATPVISTSRTPLPTSTAVTTVPATTTPAKTAPVTTTPVTATPVTATPVKAVVVSLPSEPSVATLVAEVEAAGIAPGANWSWSMGDTATRCGAIAGAGTGCTFGAAGLEYSVFTGTPTLALVAHELANAETQNDAVPGLLSDVAGAAAGTSWSPTDAVASCLVENFMGFQDNAAGTWQCPTALATVVALNIHDTLSAAINSAG